jgi:prepilin-type processing-associated H-X9-DG protein
MHTIGIMFFSYLADHDQIMPQRKYDDGTPYWQVIGNYSNTNIPTKNVSVFVCPSQTANDFPDEPSYGMNWYYDNADVSKVSNPSGTILVAETLGTSGTGSNRADKNSGDPGELDPERHYGKSNYLFFDGHVTRLAFDATLGADPTTDPGMWGTDDNNHDKLSP